MIAHARQILHPAAADHDDRMLLQIMTLARDIANHLETICQADLGNLAQRRIRLFRRCRIDPRADAPLLRTGAEMARLFTIDLFLPRLADQLTDRGHPWSFSIFPISHEPWRGDIIKPLALPLRQTAKGPKPAKASGAGFGRGSRHRIPRSCLLSIQAISRI